jgi:regulator of sigma E protease
MAGEEDPNVPRSLASKGVLPRLLIISAGSLMNFLLAVLLFSVVFMVPRDVLVGQVVVQEVAADSPAALAGISPGDTIISVDGKSVNSNSEMVRYIQLNLGKEVTLLVQHADATTDSVKVIPRWKPPEGEGAIGVVITITNTSVISQYHPFWRAIPMGAARFGEYVLAYKDGLVDLFTGKAPASFISPVGLVHITGEAAKAGIHQYLELAALISMILGICNLFPIPALDGGRIIFILLEVARRGKRVPAKVEGMVHMVGFALLLTFLLVVVYQDIIRIVSGEGLLP